MGQSRAKTPETRFWRPWQMTSRKTAPHAIPHDGTPVTYDMASPTRRRHEIRDNEEYRLRLRRGIIACAEIRRRLSGEKNKCKNKRTHALAYPPGCKGGIDADTPRLKTGRRHPTHLFAGIVSRRGSMMHGNTVGNCRNTRGTPRFGFRKFPPPASLRLAGKLKRGRLHAMSHKSPRYIAAIRESFPPPNSVGNNMLPSLTR